MHRPFVGRFIHRALLWIILVGLPTILAVIIAFTIPYYLMHNPTLANYSSTAALVIVGGVAQMIYRRTYSQRIKGTHVMSINMDSPQPVDEEHIRVLESALSNIRKDTEDYVKLLAMLGFMHLGNALAKGDRGHYRKAVDYLNRAEEAMGRVNVSDDTRLMVGRLRSKVEENRYRFEA